MHTPTELTAEQIEQVTGAGLYDGFVINPNFRPPNAALPIFIPPYTPTPIPVRIPGGF